MKSNIIKNALPVGLFTGAYLVGNVALAAGTTNFQNYCIDNPAFCPTGGAVVTAPVAATPTVVPPAAAAAAAGSCDPGVQRVTRDNVTLKGAVIRDITNPFVERSPSGSSYTTAVEKFIADHISIPADAYRVKLSSTGGEYTIGTKGIPEQKAEFAAALEKSIDCAPSNITITVDHASHVGGAAPLPAAARRVGGSDVVDARMYLIPGGKPKCTAAGYTVVKDTKEGGLENCRIPVPGDLNQLEAALTGLGINLTHPRLLVGFGAEGKSNRRGYSANRATLATKLSNGSGGDYAELVLKRKGASAAAGAAKRAAAACPKEHLVGEVCTK